MYLIIFINKKETFKISSCKVIVELLIYISNNNNKNNVNFCMSKDTQRKFSKHEVSYFRLKILFGGKCTVENKNFLLSIK